MGLFIECPLQKPIRQHWQLSKWVRVWPVDMTWRHCLEVSTGPVILSLLRLSSSAWVFDLSGTVRWSFSPLFPSSYTTLIVRTRLPLHRVYMLGSECSSRCRAVPCISEPTTNCWFSVFPYAVQWVAPLCLSIAHCQPPMILRPIVVRDSSWSATRRP